MQGADSAVAAAGLAVAPETGARRGWGLHWKLALAAAVALFLCITVLAAMLLQRQSELLTTEIERSSAELQRGMVERGRLLAEGMTASMGSAIAGHDFAFLSDTVRSLQARTEDLAYASLVSTGGSIVVHTDPSRTGDRWAGVPEEKPTFTRSTDGRSVVEIARPLAVGGKPWGWLVLGFDLTPIEQRASAAAERERRVLANSITAAVVVAALVGLAGIVASVWMSRRLLSPLTRLSGDAAAIASGDLDQPVRAVESGDEIEVLARQFEAMRRAIRANVGELVVARQRAEASAIEEKKLRAEIEQHSRLLETKVAERTAELRATAERLTEYDRLKSEFLSNVSHELRTPIAAISSSATIIQRYSDRDPSSAKRFSRVIIEESGRLTRLINDLLDLSKIESGRAEWKVERIARPVELLEHVLVTFRPLYEESGVHLELDADGDLPAIYGDRDRLIQVFANLCSNSLKFTPNGGRVVLRMAPATGEAADQAGSLPLLRVSVTDNGPGIPEAEREVVFERFRQGSGTSKPAGTGLGLAICREVVRYHCGSIRAEAPAEGGTRMVVLLPTADAEAGWPTA